MRCLCHSVPIDICDNILNEISWICRQKILISTNEQEKVRKRALPSVSSFWMVGLGVGKGLGLALMCHVKVLVARAQTFKLFLLHIPKQTGPKGIFLSGKSVLCDLSDTCQPTNGQLIVKCWWSFGHFLADSGLTRSQHVSLGHKVHFYHLVDVEIDGSYRNTTFFYKDSSKEN